MINIHIMVPASRYGNFWEYGFNVSDLKTPLYCDDYENLTEFERNYCDTNLPLRNQFKQSWLPNWDGKSESVDRNAMSRNGMDASIVMDAADPAYHAHLLQMVEIMLNKVPESAGICIDGTASWTKMSPVGDDNRTLCGGKYTCHTQVGTFIQTAKDIGERLRAEGKVFFWNPSQPRADMMMHFDGIFSELGYAMPQIALQALLTVNKVNIMWNAGCYINSSYNSPPISYSQAAGRVTAKSKPWQCGSDKWTQPQNLAELTLSLQGSLHMGIMYSPPFPGADHSAYPYPGDHKELYKHYKNLFFLLKGKRWLLKPHAIRSVAAAAAASDASVDEEPAHAAALPISNIFSTHSGVVLALGFGTPKAAVVVELSSEVVNASSAAAAAAIVHHAGGVTSSVTAKVVSNGAGIEYSVTLGGDGEAMLQIIQ